MSCMYMVVLHDIVYNNVVLLIFRIGRSGRYGRRGVAINFVKSDDIRILRDIEQYYSTQIDEMPMNSESCIFHTLCRIIYPGIIHLSLQLTTSFKETSCSMDWAIYIHYSHPLYNYNSGFCPVNCSCMSFTTTNCTHSQTPLLFICMLHKLYNYTYIS